VPSEVTLSLTVFFPVLALTLRVNSPTGCPSMHSFLPSPFLELHPSFNRAALVYSGVGFVRTTACFPNGPLGRNLTPRARLLIPFHENSSGIPPEGIPFGSEARTPLSSVLPLLLLFSPHFFWLILSPKVL